MKIAATFKNCQSNFRDVFAPKVNCKALKGLARIAAYIMAPFVCAIAHFKNRRVVAINDFLDNHTVAKTSTVYQGQFPLNQKQLIHYLTNQVKRHTAQDRERFQKGFRLLDWESQREFFQRVAHAKRLKTTLDWLPQDVTALHLSSGKSNAIYHSHTNGENAHILLKKIREFKELKNVVLDFRGVGFVTDLTFSNTDGSLLAMRQTNTVEWRGTTYNHFNDPWPIVLALRALKTLSQTHPDLDYEISFMNVNAYRKDGKVTVGGAVSQATRLQPYLQRAAESKVN